MLGPRFPKAQERARVSGVFDECLPKLQLRQLRFRRFCGSSASDSFEPLVWLADEVELRSRGRVTDAPELDLQPEEPDGLPCHIVEPLKCPSMLFGDLSRDPDNSLRVMT